MKAVEMEASVLRRKTVDVDEMIKSAAVRGESMGKDRLGRIYLMLGGRHSNGVILAYHPGGGDDDNGGSTIHAWSQLSEPHVSTLVAALHPSGCREGQLLASLRARLGTSVEASDEKVAAAADNRRLAAADEAALPESVVRVSDWDAALRELMAVAA